LDLEDDATVMFGLDNAFPVEDIQAIAGRLEASGMLTAGFIPPTAGLLAIPSMLYAEKIEGIPTILLPDTNVTTRMARIAREGRVGREDPPTRLAVDLMAFSQALNVGIEPAPALHELAQNMGNDVANETLRWFRAADTGRARQWIDLAMGRTDVLPAVEVQQFDPVPLAQPPHRWRCNYAVLLKATALELDASLTPIGRFEALMKWMTDEFILAGPASILCTMFFSETAPRAGLIKNFKSENRDKALAGVRNAAWDATYLSELTRRAKPEAYDQARCIFASADRALSGLAPLLLIDEEDPAEYRRALAARMVAWWGRQADGIAGILLDAIESVRWRPAPTAPPGVEDYVGFKIAEGEGLVRAFVPSG